MLVPEGNNRDRPEQYYPYMYATPHLQQVVLEGKSNDTEERLHTASCHVVITLADIDRPKHCHPDLLFFHNPFAVNVVRESTFKFRS